MSAADDLRPKTTLNKTTVILTTGLLLGLTLLVALLYGRICHAGFTLDEFSHLVYPYQTFNGHPEALLGKLFGSWTSGEEDGITAYRPTTCASFVIDYALWQTKVMGWHISNLLFYVVGCFLTGAVTNELLKRAVSAKAALGAGVIAGALMLVYPGHPDSVATIVGRVDSLPTAFYLASFYLYLLSRTAASKQLLVASLISFWLALGSKETAITLPVVLFVAELLSLTGPVPDQSMPDQAKPDQSASKQASIKKKFVDALKRVAPFIAILGLFAVLRTVVLHGQVGGYGKIHFKTMLKQFLNFADLSTLMKILIPINEHYPLPQPYTQAMLLSYALAALNLASQALRNKAFAKVLAFFIFWGIVNVLLTFQIWHIYPNLVGFRLFFLSSTALCAILSMGFMVDAKSKAMSVLNALAAIFLGTVWSVVLLNNLKPFEEAATMMHTLEQQVTELSATAQSKKERFLLLNLPQDFCGAPMLGKAAFLAVMMQPPLAKRDCRSQIMVSQPFGSATAVNLDNLKEEIPLITRCCTALKCYRWDEKQGRFVEAQLPQ
ncbi:hypothetical protein KA344_17950 [bacterium]|jgi:hypothetical protein|nr:hypothetical protein [bacterium]